MNPHTLKWAQEAIEDLGGVGEHELERLGAALGVGREPGEALEAYRARVQAVWNDDDVVDKAVTLDVERPAATPMVLGMLLGEEK